LPMSQRICGKGKVSREKPYKCANWKKRQRKKSRMG
jgi:hypothetical protein